MLTALLFMFIGAVIGGGLVAAFAINDDDDDF